MLLLLNSRNVILSVLRVLFVNGATKYWLSGYLSDRLVSTFTYSISVYLRVYNNGYTLFSSCSTRIKSVTKLQYNIVYIFK